MSTPHTHKHTHTHTHLVHDIDECAFDVFASITLMEHVLERVHLQRQHILAKTCTQPRQLAQRILEPTCERHRLEARGCVPRELVESAR
jgi:hypothetical protein